MQLQGTSHSQDSTGRYSCVDLKKANEIIGVTTEEVVLNATEGARFAENLPCPPTECVNLVFFFWSKFCK